MSPSVKSIFSSFAKKPVKSPKLAQKLKILQQKNVMEPKGVSTCIFKILSERLKVPLVDMILIVSY